MANSRSSNKFEESRNLKKTGTAAVSSLDPPPLPTSSRHFGETWSAEAKGPLEGLGSGHYFEESVQGSLRVIHETAQDAAPPNPMNQSLPNASGGPAEFEVKLLEQEKLSLVGAVQQATVKAPKPPAKKPSQDKQRGARDPPESSLSSKFSDIRSVRESVFNNARLKPHAGSVTGVSASKTAPLAPPSASGKKPGKAGEAKTDREKKGLQSGLYFFDKTVLGVSLAEVIDHKKSEPVGAPGSRVVYWRKSKSFVLEDGQLFKVALKEFKKSRFGVDLSRAKLESLEGFEAAVLQSNPR